MPINSAVWKKKETSLILLSNEYPGSASVFQMVWWWAVINWKGSGCHRLWGNILKSVWRDWGKLQIKTVRIVSVTTNTKTYTSKMQTRSVITWANSLGKWKYSSMLLPKYGIADRHVFEYKCKRWQASNKWQSATWSVAIKAVGKVLFSVKEKEMWFSPL